MAREHVVGCRGRAAIGQVHEIEAGRLREQDGFLCVGVPLPALATVRPSGRARAAAMNSFSVLTQRGVHHQHQHVGGHLQIGVKSLMGS